MHSEVNLLIQPITGKIKMDKTKTYSIPQLSVLYLLQSELVDVVTIYPPPSSQSQSLLETSVSIWEEAGKLRKTSRDRIRHPRYYGFSSHSLFLNGLGPWHVSPGERHSIQVLDIGLT